jgi:hypothetical protein
MLEVIAREDLKQVGVALDGHRATDPRARHLVRHP